MTYSQSISDKLGWGLERQDTIFRAGLVAPAAVVVLFVLCVPIAWMTWSSLRDVSGWTFSHYTQLVSAANLDYLAATFRIAAIVTMVSIAFGYPLALGMSLMPKRTARFCMFLVLTPFFTSILVRTYAWILLLQRRGIVNTWLQDAGLIDSPLRLVYNEVGTIIGMIHVLLPLAVLPIYGSIRSIDSTLVAAAATLGAGPIRTFFVVTLPLSLPGLVGGMVSVFVLSLGFYVTPAILGGGRVVTWAMLIETVIQYSAEWGAASALGIVLLVVTLLLLGIANHLNRTYLSRG